MELRGGQPASPRLCVGQLGGMFVISRDGPAWLRGPLGTRAVGGQEGEGPSPSLRAAAIAAGAFFVMHAPWKETFWQSSSSS